MFLYRDVLRRELDYPIAAVRAKEPQHLPAVLTKDETRRVIAQLSGIYQLQAKLLYGSGLRLLVCLRLRVKDTDFERREVTFCLVNPLKCDGLHTAPCPFPGYFG